jgi:hypothetical protein
MPNRVACLLSSSLIIYFSLSILFICTPHLSDWTWENKPGLVTGVGGFIEQHLTRYLVERGDWLRGVDIKEPEYFDVRTGAQRLLGIALRFMHVESSRFAPILSYRGTEVSPKIARIYL